MIEARHMGELNKREPSRATKRRAALDMWRPGAQVCPGELDTYNQLYENELQFDAWFTPKIGAGSSSLASGSILNKNSSIMSFKSSYASSLATYQIQEVPEFTREEGITIQT